LSEDLQQEFPDMRGLSVRNLKYMRTFAENYKYFPFMQKPPAQIHENEIVQAPLAQLIWYHHITLLDKIKNPVEREFYLTSED
jgi:hypothetical protein